jgi:hypothetical protein
VILSACESGTGEVRIGEGVMSLRRAFRIAGAETVLASHWKVSDEATSRLMTEFMGRWRAGDPRVKAWRDAQLALLRSEKFSIPTSGRRSRSRDSGGKASRLPPAWGARSKGESPAALRSRGALWRADCEA